MVTGDGKYIRDKFADQEIAEKRAMDDAQFYDRQATGLEERISSAEDRKAAREAAAAEREKDRQARAENARVMAGVAATTRQSAADARLANLEDKLADDYRSEVKQPRSVVSAFENLKSTPASAAGDISFIFQYMKILDPTSVVKETEFATVQNAGGVPDNIRNLYNRLRTGERLNSQQRQQFIGTAASLASNAQKSIQAAQQHYGSIAERRGLDARNIFDRGGQGSTVKVDY